jgi:hypothetical protein
MTPQTSLETRIYISPRLKKLAGLVWSFLFSLSAEVPSLLSRFAQAAEVQEKSCAEQSSLPVHFSVTSNQSFVFPSRAGPSHLFLFFIKIENSMGCGASTQAATAVASTHVSDKMVRDDPGKSKNHSLSVASPRISSQNLNRPPFLSFSGVAEATSATVAASVSTASKKGSDESLNRNAPVTPNGFPLETRRVSSVQSRESIRSHERLMRAEEWKVRPGYSSGASSYEGETSSEDEYEEKAQGAITEGKKEGNGVPEISSHSDMLSMLRQEMAADGDLIQTVVRIETPFGKPIEEIYNGVHDGPVLGSGVSGVVRLVVHKATGVKYAVKCLDIGLIASTEGLRQLRDEIFIMCQLDHPNIVRIEEVYESASEIYIVQELCLGGDLFDRLDQQPDYHYTEVQCARLVKQMLSSIRYLHGKGIIHR